MTPTDHTANSIQPVTDAQGRDRYSEEDEQARERAFPGTFVTRDKVEPGVVARDGGLTMIDPRPYASLLYDGAGMPTMSVQMLTFLAGPAPQRGAVKRLITALDALKDRDERAYGMLVARFDEGKSYRRIGEDFGVCHATAHTTILRSVEQLTDWVDAHAAMELEQAARAAGSLDPDNDADTDDAPDDGTPVDLVPAPEQEQVGKTVPTLVTVTVAASPDAGERAPTPLDAYWASVARRRARDAYERGA